MLTDIVIRLAIIGFLVTAGTMAMGIIYVTAWVVEKYKF